MYTMRGVVHVLVAPRMLTPQSFLLLKTKLLKMTHPFTVHTVEPNRLFWLWVSFGLMVNSQRWVSFGLSVHSWLWFGLGFGGGFFKRHIRECVKLVSEVIGFFNPNGFLWNFWWYLNEYSIFNTLYKVFLTLWVRFLSTQLGWLTRGGGCLFFSHHCTDQPSHTTHQKSFHTTHQIYTS